MTENERFDNVFARIQQAKEMPAYNLSPEFMLRVRTAEFALGNSRIDLAEGAIAMAEEIILCQEICAIANNQSVDAIICVQQLLFQNRFDEAMSLVLGETCSR